MYAETEQKGRIERERERGRGRDSKKEKDNKQWHLLTSRRGRGWYDRERFLPREMRWYEKSVGSLRKNYLKPLQQTNILWHELRGKLWLLQ